MLAFVISLTASQSTVTHSASFGLPDVDTDGDGVLDVSGNGCDL